MADFSFSFDSDNPFAEPEAAPNSAPDAPKPDAPDGPPVAPENAEAPAAPAPSVASANADAATNAPDNDEISLDSLDFAFDEGASVNDSLPTQTMPDAPSAPRQKTPGEAALSDFDFGAPETESFDSDASETEATEVFAPAMDAPVVETAADEGEKIVETESFAEPIAKTPKNKNSDLDEFNAMNFDLAGSSQATLGETVAEVADEPAATATDSPDFLVDLDDEIDSAPDDIIADDAASVSAEMPADEAQIVTEISVPDAVAAASFDSAQDETQAESETENESEARPRRLKTTLSVAILGASGIGKNHARWFHRNGCRVVGFLGTSDDSTAQTEAELNAEFPFDGKSYTDLGELLAAEKPDIVCVATPPALHFGHVLQSLEAGANVLCEKPLVYAPTRKFRENRDGAKELVKVAAKKKLILSTQLQYGAATPILCKLAGLSPSDVGDFAMELESLNPNSPRDPHELWIDMGPHPISVAQMLAGPDAKLAEETIRFEPSESDDKTEVLARFGINCADGRLLMVRAVVRSLRDATRQPRRRFSFNGHSIIYAPLQGEKGNFHAQFIAPDGYASAYADPVDYLIGDFVRACREGGTPLISGDFGRENLEWMLKVAGDK